MVKIVHFILCVYDKLKNLRKKQHEDLNALEAV